MSSWCLWVPVYLWEWNWSKGKLCSLDLLVGSDIWVWLSLRGLSFSVRYPWKESISMTSSLSWSVPLKGTFHWLVMELPANELQLPVEDSGDGQYRFKTSFINPFSTRSYKTCFVMICPAHQVRHYNLIILIMRAICNTWVLLFHLLSNWRTSLQLCAVQGKRGKKLWEGRHYFWPAVNNWSISQGSKGLGRHVPGLRYSYVQRDCWPRLNVMPAKIMQVREGKLF